MTCRLSEALSMVENDTISVVATTKCKIALIDKCKGLSFLVQQSVVCAIEVVRSSDVTIELAETGCTVQLDVCDRVKIVLGPKCLCAEELDRLQIVHSGSREIDVVIRDHAPSPPSSAAAASAGKGAVLQTLRILPIEGVQQCLTKVVLAGSKDDGEERKAAEGLYALVTTHRKTQDTFNGIKLTV
jgi:hypothetical protein